MSLLFSNYFLPLEYDLSLILNQSKPNYLGKVIIKLTKNDKFNSCYLPTNKGNNFAITLNTSEIISMSAILSSDDKSWKLSQSLNREDECTTYFTDELSLNDLTEQNINTLTLEIKFMAVVRKIMTYSDMTKGVFSTRYTDPISGKSDMFLLSTHSQPHFARYIFPCLDDINCKCPIQLELTVDNNFTCISNLPIQSSTFISETSNKLVKFQKSPPMTTSVFSFAVGNFDYLEKSVNLPVTNASIPIKIYTMVGESDRATYALEIVSKALVELEKKFNVEYPLPKLDLVALPFLSDGGVENWSMIQVINDHILLPDYQVSNHQLSNVKKSIRDVLVHELVHMYVGDYISFDSYDYTWMNESFATFMSNTIINSIFDENTWYNVINSDLHLLKSRNLEIDSKPIHTENVKTDKIHDTFSRNSYEKGIFLLRSLASLFVDDDSKLNNENYDVFFGMIGDFIRQNKFQNFKPIDLWNFLKTHKSNKFSYDIPTIMNSWIRTPGFPILTVTKEENGSFKVEQTRCLDDPEVSQDDIEDIPFQIPLLIKKADGKLGRQFMTDRSLLISNEGINDSDDDFFFLNANDAFMLNISYTESIYKAIASKFNTLNKVEQMQFFKNFSSVIGTKYQTNDCIISFFRSIKAIKKVNKPDHAAMSFGISILSNLYKSINTLAYFDDAVLYKKINIFIDELCNKYIAQLEWDNVKWDELTPDELKLRNSILSLKYDNHLIQQVGKKMFKKVLHGPKASIPVELVTTVFSIAAQTATLKDYKEISKLVRNPGLVVNNIINGSPNDIQTAAINSLGCMTDPELRYKTFNFVATNPDVKMIELSLLGLRFQMDAYKELWKWYITHYAVWYSKYVRDNKYYQGLFFKHVSELALECAYYDSELRKEVENFIASKHDDVKLWFDEAKEKFANLQLLNEADNDLKSIL